MKFKLAFSLMGLMCFAGAAFAQTEITIKKKFSLNFPGMDMMPAGTKKEMDDTLGRNNTVYLKGGKMRTDTVVSMRKKSGAREKITYSSILRCDQQRHLSFNSKKKKYYQESLSGQTSADVKNSKKGGYITLSGSVTDTGERAKVFGYEAKHLKQIMTITPGPNACQKSKLSIEIEGWYADIPEFSCPMKRHPTEFQMGENCFDEVDYQIKGAVTGVALKEVKKITMDGQTMTFEEEATEITKGALADSLFDPPTNYSAANTLREVQENAAEEATPQTGETTSPTPPTLPSNNSTPTFAPPTAGLEKAPLGEKKSGMMRIGVAKPKITTPDSKKDPGAGDEIATATQNSLIESLKAENVEAIALETDFPENECKEKGCDYIFYANVTQKRGGGGMFKSMIMMGAVTAAGMMVPGIGGMIASTVASQVMNQTMNKNAKAKDEFSFDYQVVGMDKNVISKATTKNKTEKDGEDILTPQIQQASKTVLAALATKVK